MVLDYQQKRNFDFILKSCQYSRFKLRYGQKKNQPPILQVQVDSAIPVNQHVRHKFYNNNKKKNMAAS